MADFTLTVGNDVFTAPGTNDRVFALAGNDSVNGGNGDDELYGDPGNDTLSGGVGNDLLRGAGGTDSLLGGDGDDFFSLNEGPENDVINGGAGADRVVFQTSGTYDIAAGGLTVTGVERFEYGGTTIRIAHGFLDPFATLSAGSVIFAAGGTTNISGATVLGGGMNFTGSAGADIVTLPASFGGSVSFSAGPGNDNITGSGGQDTLFGEGGNDTLSGGPGTDTLRGGDGTDTINGNEGDDFISLNEGPENDVINGGAGADSMVFQISGAYNIAAGGLTVTGVEHFGFGGTSIRVAHGFLDPFTSLSFGTVVFAAGGATNLSGATILTGAATFTGSAAADIVTLPAGFSGPVFFSAGLGNDNITSSAGGDAINGEGGNDTIAGGDGPDELRGAGGSDTLNGEGGDDFFPLQEAPENDVINGGSGSDRMAFVIGGAWNLSTGGLNVTGVERFDWGGSTITVPNGFLSQFATINPGLTRFSNAGTTNLLATDILTGGINIEGSTGVDMLYMPPAFAGQLIFTAGLGNDAVFSYGGADIISGGGGDDSIIAGIGSDQVNGNDGIDILFGSSFDTAGAPETSSGDDTIDGGAGSDRAWGFDEDDLLRGQAGDDFLTAGQGDDLAEGGDGADFLIGGEFLAAGGFVPNSGADTLSGGAGGDAIYGADGNDIINGDAGNEYVEGGLGDDTINGGTENDTLLGNQGSDFLTAGTGFDYLYGGAGADTFNFRRNDSYDAIWDFSIAQGDKLRLDPGFGVTNFAQFQTKLVGFTSGGQKYTYVDFTGLGDQMQVQGLLPAEWTPALLEII